ncbi:hypothetical protein D7X33_22620 [Butyricicoccus sp. 1XD8-22]|nr:hypothetical protein D7X33_22620 [Butyricicoccus sp. 1XD8-22]
MAKLGKKYEFKNAEVNLEEGLIYEYDKNNESYEVHSLNVVLKELESCGRTDFSINTATTPTPLEEV